MVPTVGRIVHYRLSADDVGAIAVRRDRSAGTRVGNALEVGATVAMVIVRVWAATCVNGQALLDGNDSLWRSSAQRGPGPGQWDWPPRSPPDQSGMTVDQAAAYGAQWDG